MFHAFTIEDDHRILKENLRRLLVPLITKIHNEKPRDLIDYCGNYFENLRNVSEECCFPSVSDTQNIKTQNLQGSASFPIISDHKEVRLRETSSWNHPKETRKSQKHKRSTLYNKVDFSRQMGDQLDIARENKDEGMSEGMMEAVPHTELKSTCHFENDYQYQPFLAEKDFPGGTTNFQEKGEDPENIPLSSSYYGEMDSELRDLVNQFSSPNSVNSPDSPKYRKRWTNEGQEQQFPNEPDCSNSSSSDSAEYEEGSDYLPLSDEDAYEAGNMSTSGMSPFCDESSRDSRAEESSSKYPKLNFTRINDLVHSFSMTFQKLVKDLHKAESFLRMQAQGSYKKYRKNGVKTSTVRQITHDELQGNTTKCSPDVVVNEHKSEKNLCRIRGDMNRSEETIRNILGEYAVAATAMNLSEDENCQKQDEFYQNNEAGYVMTSTQKEDNLGKSFSEIQSNIFHGNQENEENKFIHAFKNDCSMKVKGIAVTSSKENEKRTKEPKQSRNVQQGNDHWRRGNIFSFDSNKQQSFSSQRIPVRTPQRETARVPPTMAMSLMGEQGDVPPHIQRRCSVGTETDRQLRHVLLTSETEDDDTSQSNPLRQSTVCSVESAGPRRGGSQSNSIEKICTERVKMSPTTLNPSSPEMQNQKKLIKCSEHATSHEDITFEVNKSCKLSSNKSDVDILQRNSEFDPVLEVDSKEIANILETSGRHNFKARNVSNDIPKEIPRETENEINNELKKQFINNKTEVQEEIISNNESHEISSERQEFLQERQLEAFSECGVSNPAIDCSKPSNDSESISNDSPTAELIHSMEATKKDSESDQTTKDKSDTTEPGWTSACGDYVGSNFPLSDSSRLNKEESRSNEEDSCQNDGLISLELVEHAIREALEAQSKSENCMDFDYFYDSDTCSSDLSSENISDENNDL